jgi:hypothetical protein
MKTRWQPGAAGGNLASNLQARATAEASHFALSEDHVSTLHKQCTATQKSETHRKHLWLRLQKAGCCMQRREPAQQQPAESTAAASLNAAHSSKENRNQTHVAVVIAGAGERGLAGLAWPLSGERSAWSTSGCMRDSPAKCPAPSRHQATTDAK